MVTLPLRKRAFTLIELLIVITIIGILAVALIPRLTGGPARARDAQRKSDLQQLATALEFYADDNGTYPASSYCVNVSTFTAMVDDYLTTVPTDPTDKRPAFGGATNPCTTTPYSYAYMSLNSGTGYMLIADMETNTDKDEGVYNATFSVSTSATASSNLSTNSGTACSAMTCTDAILVIGR